MNQNPVAMRYTLLCLFFAAVCGLTSCLEEERREGLAPNDGFSDPADLRFSSGEFATLSEVLDIEPEVTVTNPITPLHFGGGGSGMSADDARKALLGRVLFYDKQLSATGETSCASCHKQELAFADDLAFSKGINGMVTQRNSLGLASVPSFSPEISGYGSTSSTSFAASPGRVQFFWDERASTISQQSLLTIEDEREMGSDLVELSQRLRQQEIYQILSVKAYGTPELTPARITLALEKFCSTISAMNTRFDRMLDLELNHRTADLNQEFSDIERRGKLLYDRNCASCHSSSLGEPTVTIANNGLDARPTDAGVGGFLKDPAKNGMFKVPFLRNVMLTAPYMHDGRFATLREVIEHYSHGIQDAPNLAVELHENNDLRRGPVRMNFSEEDIEALLAFFALTTDETVATEKSISDPFRR